MLDKLLSIFFKKSIDPVVFIEDIIEPIPDVEFKPEQPIKFQSTEEQIEEVEFEQQPEENIVELPTIKIIDTKRVEHSRMRHLGY